MTSLAAVVRALTIMEDDDLLAPELFHDGCLDTRALDRWLADNGFIVVAYQENFINFKALVNFQGELIDIQKCANFGAVLATASADNCVHSLDSNLRLPPPPYRSVVVIQCTGKIGCK
jgi:hypothetical protein